MRVAICRVASWLQLHTFLEQARARERLPKGVVCFGSNDELYQIWDLIFPLASDESFELMQKRQNSMLGLTSNVFYFR